MVDSTGVKGASFPWADRIAIRVTIEKTNVATKTPRQTLVSCERTKTRTARGEYWLAASWIATNAHRATWKSKCSSSAIMPDRRDQRTRPKERRHRPERPGEPLTSREVGGCPRDALGTRDTSAVAGTVTRARRYRHGPDSSVPDVAHSATSRWASAVHAVASRA